MSKVVGFARSLGSRGVSFGHYVAEVFATNYKNWLADKGKYLVKDAVEHENLVYKWFYTKAFRLPGELSAIGDAVRGNMKVYHLAYAFVLIQFDMLIYHYLGRWLERGAPSKINFEYFMEMDKLYPDWYKRRQPEPRVVKDGQKWN
eukprot:TRINITY_DN1976_c0_g1_i4.p1 TRINITY_DN1976_c0_g1~~TRINITY_DN1976_c0_g1_i4.p1  ORF type:complete len:155 (+),score=4.65 TRINITY_DN1976_c0_g1_i4:28-465(+)